MRKSTPVFLLTVIMVFVGLQQGYGQHSGIAPRFGELWLGQATPSAVTPTNYHKDYLKRFKINQPASVAGTKAHTVSNNGRQDDWGRLIDSTWDNVTLIRVTDSLACPGKITNGAAISGNWAFLYRGDCEFGAKAKAAQDAGAKGVVMVNNVPGGPVSMGAGAQGGNVTIPVVMISKEDGDAINTELRNGQTVTMSLSGWSFGATHDLGILNTGAALWHSYAIPKIQLASDNGNPLAYQAITGAFIGNFGTSNESGVVLKNTISFTPTGGSPTVLKKDSVEIPAFAFADSIMYGFTDDVVDFHATGTGRLDASYTLTFDNTDEIEEDNELTVSSYVTDSIYSKGKYDFAAGKPVVGQSYGFLDGSPFIWGPLYYMAKADYAIRYVQFSTSTGANGNPVLEGQSPFYIYVFEWDDANGDSIMTSDELKLTGTGKKDFVAGDSSGQVFTAKIFDADINGHPFITKANKWYWVAADVPAGWYLGVDGVSNYYPRHFFRKDQATPFRDPYAPMYHGLLGGLLDPGNVDGIQLLPFESYYIGDSARYSQQKTGLVPAIALHMSQDIETGVSDVPEMFTEVSLYPNPATDAITVKLGLAKTSSHVDLKVIDAVGRNMMKFEKHNVLNETYTIPTSSLAPGVYYLVIGIDGSATAKKFVIEK